MVLLHEESAAATAQLLYRIESNLQMVVVVVMMPVPLPVERPLLQRLRVALLHPHVHVRPAERDDRPQLKLLAHLLLHGCLLWQWQWQHDEVSEWQHDGIREWERGWSPVAVMAESYDSNRSVTHPCTSLGVRC